MRKHAYFLVHIDPMPEDVSLSDMRLYIKAAVGAWNGQYHPDEPLFDLEIKDVKVKIDKHFNM